MRHPRIGERAFVRPTCPSLPVQRGEGLFGSFLPAAGADVLFDEFLLRRLGEGVIEVVSAESSAAPADKENG
ncbi:MAG: hypothetical protein U1A78_32235 [Polyangia bacterium]